MNKSILENTKIIMTNLIYLCNDIINQTIIQAI